MNQDHPGVRFPPPFIYVGFIILGLLLQRVWPIAVVPQGLAAPFGIAFFVLGFTIAFAGVRELTRHKTTIRPDQSSSRIVRSGPYRFTRNPLYVSLSTLHLAVGLWTNSLWVVLLLAPALLVMARQVITREEAYLERAFGEQYLSYKNVARRWL